MKKHKVMNRINASRREAIARERADSAKNTRRMDLLELRIRNLEGLQTGSAFATDDPDFAKLIDL